MIFYLAAAASAVALTSVVLVAIALAADFGPGLAKILAAVG